MKIIKFLFILSTIIIVNGANDFVELVPSQSFYDKADLSFHLTIADIKDITQVTIEMTFYVGNCDIKGLYSDESMQTEVETSLLSAARKIIFKTDKIYNNYCLKDVTAEHVL